MPESGFDHASGASPRRHDLRFNLPGGHTIAARVVAPATLPAGKRPAMLCCVPGGGATLGYFDLAVSGDLSYSFAEFAATRGQVVIAVDNLGTGGSDRPDPLITPTEVAAANSAAFARAALDLRRGSLLPDQRPLPPPVTIGVGHSMGAMLTILAQAADRVHAGIAALGFTTSGMPDLLRPRERLLAGTPKGRTQLVQLAAERLSGLPSDAPRVRFPFHVEGTPAAAARAYAATATTTLPAPSALAMIPGNVAEEAASIAVPVFLGVGDHEPWHQARELAPQYPASHDVTVYVLKGAAHLHNLAPTRHQLWARMCRWAAGVAADASEGGEG